MSDIETCIEAYGEDEANQETMERAQIKLAWLERTAARCEKLENVIFEMSCAIMTSTASAELKLQIQKIYSKVVK